jgi:hypothetical protein
VTEQHREVDEKTLLDLLSKGDVAGLEAALGMEPGGFGRIMAGDPGLDDEAWDDDADLAGGEDFFGGDGDGEEEEWLPRPEWLHPQCRNVCSALELGTCCGYPDASLVRLAVRLADSADRAVGRLGELPCDEAAAELAGCFRMIPGLLAQIHAVLPSLGRTARAQLLCPVGRLAGALDAACGDGCPWGCAEGAVPDRREEFRALLDLVAECSAAVRSALGQPGPGRAPAVPVPRRPLG